MLTMQIIRSFFQKTWSVVSFYLRRIKSFGRSSPVQRSRCRDGVSIRFRIWRLYDLSWRNRRCLVLLINNQDVILIGHDVLYTCWSLCRLRSSDLSKDARLICAQLECVILMLRYVIQLFILSGSPVVRNSSEGFFSALSLMSKTVQFRIWSRIPTVGLRNQS